MKKAIAFLLAGLMLIGNPPMTLFASEESNEVEETNLNDPLNSEEESEISMPIQEESIEEDESDQLVFDTFEYEVEDDHVIITKYIGTELKVNVPSLIGGQVVKEIGNEAFCGNDVVESIFVPESVIMIGDYAFAECPRLKEIWFEADDVSIGENAFYAIDATVFYPFDEGSWTENVRNTYGGTIVWVVLQNEPEQKEEMAAEEEKTATEEAIEPEMSAAPQSAAAILDDDISGILYSGTCGDNLTWKYDDTKTLTISGEGDMFNYTSSTTENTRAPWCKDALNIRREIAHVVISEGVTSIGNYAFEVCSNIEDFQLPSTLAKVGDNAFANVCWKLQSVEIPNGVTALGDYVFSGCTNLESVVLPDSIQKIGNGLFDGCSKLKTLNRWPSRCSYIPTFTFRNCGLTYFDMPSTVITIEAYAFYASVFSNLRLSDNINRIGEYAFNNCKNLKTIHMPLNLKGLKNNTFYKCSSLQTIEIPAMVSSLGKNVFTGCSALTEIKFTGNAPQLVGSSAFTGTNAAIYYPKSTQSKQWEKLAQEKFGSKNVWVEGDYWVDENAPEVVHGNIFTYNGHVYEIVDEGMTWQAAQAACVQKGGHLVTITDEAEQEFIKSIISNHDKNKYWIGLSKSGSTYQWVTGEPYQYHYNDFWHDGSSLVFMFAYNGVTLENMDVRAGGWEDHYNENTTGEYGYNKYMGYVCEYDDESINVNNDIVERVKEYTSDDMFDMYFSIINDDSPWDVKMHELQLFFSSYGFANIHEGSQYLSATTNKRLAYLQLTTNEVYAANNFVEWLSSGPDALAKRLVLVADGLVFNNEVSAWLDISTYIRYDMGDPGALPGVKKYKEMLYDFMEAEADEILVEEDIKFISDLLSEAEKNYTNLAGKVDNVAHAYADKVIEMLDQCKSQDDTEALVNYLLEKNILTELAIGENKDGQLIFNLKLDSSSGYGEFSKLMGYGTKTLSLVNLTLDEIKDFITLDARFAVYARYEQFLEEVENDRELPNDLRLAAASVLKEIEDGQLSYFENLFWRLEKETKIDSKIRELILSELGAGSFSIWLKAVGITSFFINWLTDIGSMVKREAYVEGYWYLSNCYVKRLERSKEAFKANPTTENAWDFYYNYNILYRLRYKGEEAYLKMTKVEGLIGKLYDFGYAEKEKAVNNTLKELETRCKFTMETAQTIPENVRFASKTIISCPVNVEIYAPDGTLIVALEDGIESDITNTYGRFACIFDNYIEDYIKVIAFNDEDDFDIRIIGKDEGLVNVKVIASQDSATIYRIANLPIDDKTEIRFSIGEIERTGKYVIEDSTGDKEYSFSVFDYDVQAEVITLNNVELNLKIGDASLLIPDVKPAETPYQEVLWRTADSTVATVNDGKVCAIGKGTTTVYCISETNEDIFATCLVTVGDETMDTGIKLIGHTLSLTGNIGINYYMQLPEEVLADAGANMVFTMPDGTTTKIPVSQGTKRTINGVECRMFTCEVNSTQMTAEVSAQIVLSDGVKSEEYPYSVKEYADYLITNADTVPAYAKAAPMIKKMLNFGGYAQDYFQYDSATRANIDLPDEEKDISSITTKNLSSFKAIKSGSTKGINYIGSSLVLKSETSIRHYFEVQSGYAIKNFSFSCNGKKLTPIASGKYYYVEIPNIASGDLDTAYKVTVGGFSIQYSALSYAETIISNSSSDEGLKNMLKALYQYNQAANAYFGK